MSDEFDYVTPAPKNRRTYQIALWNPIETAPRDGTEIDLWCRNISHGSDDAIRVPCMYWDDEIGRWTDWRDDMLEQKWLPTHWMPLPEPPK